MGCSLLAAWLCLCQFQGCLDIVLLLGSEEVLINHGILLLLQGFVSSELPSRFQHP